MKPKVTAPRPVRPARGAPIRRSAALPRPVTLHLAAIVLTSLCAGARVPAHAQEPAAGPVGGVAPAPVGSRFT